MINSQFKDEIDMTENIQMFDAGTALFKMDDSFGTALGQVKAEMSEFGRVTAEGDCFILDISNLWRKYYISCHLEYTGEDGKHSYAAVFKEGGKGSAFRNVVFATMFAFAVAVCIKYSVLGGIASGIVFTYLWIVPGKKGIRVTRKLIEKISRL